jgi:hypothetical protein
MYSIAYKGWFIQGDFDDKKITVVSSDSQVIHRVKSIHAAKCFITRRQG